MTSNELQYGWMPAISRNAPSGLHYPLDLNVVRRMANSIGMLYGKVRNGGTTWHHGWDLYATPDTPVLSIDDGEVMNVWNSGNGPHCYGKQVLVKLKTKHSGGKDLYFHAAHLNGFSVQKGQSVKMGQMLGVTGTTGNADISAPHLHFELRTDASAAPGRVNPADYFPELYAAYLNAVGLSEYVTKRW